MKVAVAGMRAERLCRLLEREPDTALEFVYLSGSLHDIDPDRAGARVLIAAADAGHETLDSLLGTVRDLRTAHFFRGSIYLLLPDALILTDDELQRKLLSERWGVHLHDETWGIYVDRLPPWDALNLRDSIAAADPLEATKWREICLSGIRALAEQTAQLVVALTPGLIVTAQELRQSLGAVYEALKQPGVALEHSKLAQAITRLLETPEWFEPELAALAPLVGEAEAEARAANAALHRVLHKLKNDLALPGRDRGDWQEMGAGLKNRVMCMLRVADDFAGLDAVCRGLAGALDSDLDHVAAELQVLQGWLASNDPSTYRVPEGTPIRRILVVEDHPQWREQILRVVRDLSLELPVETASDVRSARRLLADNVATLAIVDLGLPQKSGEHPVPEAGLALAREFSALRQGDPFQHRFLILTAAGNNEAVVREAVGLGISATRYLQKSRDVCDSELPAQIRLALQPPPHPWPRVEIFLRTGRVARVEGAEILLDRPWWCLLGALAERPQRFVPVSRLARTMLREPYEVDPKAQNPARRAVLEEERIAQQIPYYVSELRKKLDEAYRLARGEPPVVPLVESSEEEDEESAYRLNAAATILRQPREAKVIRRPRVLVLEDHDGWRASITRELEARGFEVRVARWVDEALAMLQDEQPDLVSLDLELPVSERAYLAGLADAANALRFFELLRGQAMGLPVAVLTGAKWNDSVVMPMLRRGIRLEDYLSKNGPQPAIRLAASLNRLWRETQSRTRILDWEPDAPLHPLHFDPATKMLTHIGSHAVSAPRDRGKLLRILSETPNLFVSRMELIHALYSDLEEWDNKNLDNSLSNALDRLRKDLEQQTGIPADQILCGEKGAYMLRGIPV